MVHDLAAAERIGGTSRYATAALSSARTFEPGVPTVDLATGVDFPDALSAGAATRGSSPVLLVQASSIPGAHDPDRRLRQVPHLGAHQP